MQKMKNIIVNKWHHFPKSCQKTRINEIRILLEYTQTFVVIHANMSSQTHRLYSYGL